MGKVCTYYIATYECQYEVWASFGFGRIRFQEIQKRVGMSEAQRGLCGAVRKKKFVCVAEESVEKCGRMSVQLQV